MIGRRLGRRRTGAPPPAGSPAPQPLLGAIDVPRADGVVGRGRIPMRGWALGTNQNDIRVVIGDTVVLSPRHGRPRPDVATALPGWDGAHASGWDGEADLATVPLGDAVVRLEIRDTAGTFRTVDRRAVHVVEGGASMPIAEGLQGSVDVPLQGESVSALVVHGWALDSGELPCRVEVEFDGVVHRARLGLPRSDVADEVGGRHAPVAGFECDAGIDADLRTPREVRIRVTAHGHGGDQRVLGERRVRLAAPSRTDNDDADAELLAARRRLRPQPLRPVPEDTLRVVVATHRLDLGGAQLYLVDLLRQLLAPGDIACSLIAFVDGPLRATLEELGVRVHVTSPVPLDPTAEYEGRVSELAALVTNWRPHVALANTMGSHAVVDALADVRVPTLWAIHESYNLDQYIRAAHGPVSPLARGRIARLVRDCPGLLFESDATRAVLADHIPPSRAHVIPYGIDVENGASQRPTPEQRTLWRRERQIPDNANVLLCVGTVEPRKSQTALVAAFESVAADHDNAFLVLVGDRPDVYGQALRTQIAASPLSHRIRLVPVTPEIEPWYGCADWLVSASDVESIPRSMLESMLRGVPVVAVDAFGVGELVEQGRSGILAPERDLGALRKALEDAILLPASERAQMGIAAADRVRQDHDLRGYGTRVRALLEDLARL